jgi:hypothetical protein
MIAALWGNFAVANFCPLDCFKNGELLAPLTLSTHNGIELILKSQHILQGWA